MQDLNIQIVNYKTKQYIKKCLADVFSDLRSSKLDYTINVLDNNSGDDLEDLKQEHNNKNINIFYSKTNLGFGGGHNLLSKKVEANFILILNPDLEFIEKNTIERLFQRSTKIKEQRLWVLNY